MSCSELGSRGRGCSTRAAQKWIRPVLRWTCSGRGRIGGDVCRGEAAAVAAANRSSPATSGWISYGPEPLMDWGACGPSGLLRPKGRRCGDGLEIANF